MNTTTEHPELISHAIEQGRDFGEARGSWVIDGNTSSEACLKILYGYYDGDPEIMDMMPAPLSGEWAGESMKEIEAQYGVDLDNEEIVVAFEQGYGEGYWEVVISHCKINVPLPIDISVPEGLDEFFIGQVNAMFEAHYPTNTEKAFAALVEATRTYANMIGDKPWYVADAIRENVEPA